MDQKNVKITASIVGKVGRKFWPRSALTAAAAGADRRFGRLRARAYSRDHISYRQSLSLLINAEVTHLQTIADSVLR